MRKANAILTLLILLLFLLHGILGGFQLFGAGNVISKALSHTLLLLIALHAGIGIFLTVQSLRSQNHAGVSYGKYNRMFWTRRWSGFLIMGLLFFHVWAFTERSGEVLRLRWFTTGRLITQIFLLLSIGIHVFSNIEPLLISLGIRKPKKWVGDFLFFLTIVLAFMALAFVVYYLRWNRMG